MPGQHWSTKLHCQSILLSNMTGQAQPEPTSIEGAGHADREKRSECLLLPRTVAQTPACAWQALGFQARQADRQKHIKCVLKEGRKVPHITACLRLAITYACKRECTAASFSRHPAQHSMHGRHALHHVTAAANIQQLCHRDGLLFDSHQMNNTTGIQAYRHYMRCWAGACARSYAPMHPAQQQCWGSGMDLGFRQKSLVPLNSPTNSSKEAV